jgi:hypothetical protein
MLKGLLVAACFTISPQSRFVVQRAELPIDTAMNLVIVQPTLRTHRVTVLLDSGFGNSVIDATTASAIGLRVTQPVETAAPGGAVEEASAEDVDIKFGSARHRIKKASVIDLAGISSLLGRHVDGILGHDFFEHFVVEIQYAKQKVVLHEPQSYRYAGRGERVPLFIRNNEPFLVAQLKQANRPEVTALLKIDTGSADFIGFNGSFVDSTRLFREDEPRVPAPGVAIGGKTENYLTRLDAFTVGEITIARPVVGFSTDLTRIGDAGTIGGSFLHRFRAIFDYSRRELILEPTRDGHAKEEHWDMSGLLVIARGALFDTLLIANVTQASPAERAGLKAGDVIVAVNGRQDVTLASLRALLGSAGQLVSLDVMREGTSHHFAIRTAQII